MEILGYASLIIGYIIFVVFTSKKIFDGDEIKD